jgi:HAD superfamily hydrolase (TIGR01509 family)
MIKAIIFDMDGVLVDASDWHYRALNKALGHFGYKISLQDHKKKFDGLPTLKKLELLTIAPQLYSSINELKQKYTVEMIEKFCNPNLELKETLIRLKEEGYKLSVASNSMGKTVDLILLKSGLINYFEFYLSNEDVLKTKPNPEIYFKTMEKHNFSPKESLILEDNQNGIKAAIDSGAHLMRVHKISEVNYQNIKKVINRINSFHINNIRTPN